MRRKESDREAESSSVGNSFSVKLALAHQSCRAIDMRFRVYSKGKTAPKIYEHTLAQSKNEYILFEDDLNHFVYDHI